MFKFIETKKLHKYRTDIIGILFIPLNGIIPSEVNNKVKQIHSGGAKSILSKKEMDYLRSLLNKNNELDLIWKEFETISKKYVVQYKNAYNNSIKIYKNCEKETIKNNHQQTKVQFNLEFNKLNGDLSFKQQKDYDNYLLFLNDINDYIKVYAENNLIREILE